MSISSVSLPLSSTRTAQAPTTANRILKALDRSEFQRLAPHLSPVTLWGGEILYHPNEPIRYVFFPNRGTVSVISDFADGGTVEVGMVGNEGMIGVNVFLGTISTPLLAQVQMAGDGLRMRADRLKDEFAGCGQLQDLLLRYTQAFITQISQSAACNLAHGITERLSKWLLMCQDRSQSSDLELTHEFISTKLGVRRAGISMAAAELRSAGVISYKRGHIFIIDRRALENHSCECYPILKKEFQRLMAESVN